MHARRRLTPLATNNCWARRQGQRVGRRRRTFWTWPLLSMGMSVGMSVAWAVEPRDSWGLGERQPVGGARSDVSVKVKSPRWSFAPNSTIQYTMYARTARSRITAFVLEQPWVSGSSLAHATAVCRSLSNTSNTVSNDEPPSSHVLRYTCMSSCGTKRNTISAAARGASLRVHRLRWVALRTVADGARPTVEPRDLNGSWRISMGDSIVPRQCLQVSASSVVTVTASSARNDVSSLDSCSSTCAIPARRTVGGAVRVSGGCKPKERRRRRRTVWMQVCRERVFVPRSARRRPANCRPPAAG